MDKACVCAGAGAGVQHRHRVSLGTHTRKGCGAVRQDQRETGEGDKAVSPQRGSRGHCHLLASRGPVSLVAGPSLGLAHLVQLCKRGAVWREGPWIPLCR